MSPSIRSSMPLLAVARFALFLFLQLAAVPAGVAGTPTVSPARRQLNRRAGHNDYSCRSSAHPNPVVLLHGLGATYYEDLNFLEAFLQGLDFCTFSLTYGAYPDFPLVGGLVPIEESASEIAAFIQGVSNGTGAASVDLVGHSEGAFQVLYVPKFEPGVAAVIGNQVAIAPPTHGTTFAGLYDIAGLLGGSGGELVTAALNATGCPACADLLPGGAAVTRLAGDGQPILQAGLSLTVIASRYDELVTPTETAFVTEAGVSNIYVQDYCPLDLVGHIGEAYDLNVWNLVLNALEDVTGRSFLCVLGSPGRV